MLLNNYQLRIKLINSRIKKKGVQNHKAHNRQLQRHICKLLICLKDALLPPNRVTSPLSKQSSSTKHKPVKEASPAIS